MNYDNQPLSARGTLLLDAAQHLFFTRGFDETSLEMIINEVGGSRRSIYNEFGNKHGLLVAVINRQLIKQTEMLTSINRELSAEAALNDVCFRFAQGMLSKTLISLFRLVVQQVVKSPEFGEMIFDRGPMKAVLPLAQYLEELTEQGILKVVDAHTSAQVLLKMSEGPLYTRSLLLPDTLATDEEIKKQVANAVAIFIKAHTTETTK
ncbi:TetR/AcrR family transcriptional regulator [Colwellia asteriadis]|uniref:TetR/AcrR family transcriptional regulator n=1 Tax=Colwellia asteriadis TaxID=517723 RepID=A0ABP3WCA1_9GAMM